MVANPEGIIAAPIDKLDQCNKFVDARMPGLGRRLGTAMDGLDADAQSRVEQ